MSTETGGVTLSIEERIKQDAIQIAKDELDNSKPYPSWEYLIEKGALSERNKTVEEAQEVARKFSEEFKEIDMRYKVIIELINKLESLKV